MLWNNVETKPYGFYPLGWDLQALERLGGGDWQGSRYSGRTLFEAAEAGERVLGWRPEELDYAHPNVGEDDCAEEIYQGAHMALEHSAWFFYLARICNHCTYPACLASCPRGSIYKRPEDGVVLVDQQRCRGYQECVKGCPYKKVFFNPMTGTSEKCIGCYPKMEQQQAPQCFVNCIGKIRMAGYVSTPDQAREDNPIDYLVHVRKLALPLFPQFGLEPNVYYIPPIHVPRPFLDQMFGPGVEAAIAAYRNAPNDPDLAGLLALFGSTEAVVHRFKRQGDKMIGFGEGGREVIRVPTREPPPSAQRLRPALQRRAHQLSVRSETMRTRITIAAISLLLVLCGCGPGEEHGTPEVQVLQVEALPEDVTDAIWDDATFHDAELILQDLVEPRLLEASTPRLRIRAVTDGDRIGFHMRWVDATRDDRPGASRFSDACAVQLPAEAGADVPAPQMGEEGRSVEIAYWRASWQAVVDGREDTIAALYPNASIDHYPFEAPSLTIGSTEQGALAAQYAPARALGPVDGRSTRESGRGSDRPGAGHAEPCGGPTLHRRRVPERRGLAGDDHPTAAEEPGRQRPLPDRLRRLGRTPRRGGGAQDALGVDSYSRGERR